MKKRVMLYFGSFNPIHRGHIALSEYILDRNLADEVVLIVSPQNPLKSNKSLAPEHERFAMAELATKESRYPNGIKPSVIEFLLERPSYTINTLNHLTENYGEQMEFSVLIGADNLAIFDPWKEWEMILKSYTIYVYPREGYNIELYLDRVKVLQDAPMQNYSSTEVREAIQQGKDVSKMAHNTVIEHIAKNKLWRAESDIERLNRTISTTQNDAERVTALIERGKWYHRHNEWGKALNDFNAAIEIEPTNHEAIEFVTIIQEILKYRYIDIHNP